MRRDWKVSRQAAAMVLLTVLLSGCADFDTGSGPASAVPVTEVGAEKTETKKTEAGCWQPGERVRQFLPVFDTSRPKEKTIEPVAKNPCVPPIAGLAGEVDGLIPAGSRTKASRFVDGVRGLADRFLTAAEVTKCGYETDRLAIAIYHHTDHKESVGVVVVVRGSIDAAIDVAKCYVLGQVPRDLPSPPTARPEPTIDPCIRSTLPSRGSDSYAVFWVGSTDWMCSALSRAIPRE